MHQIAKFVSLSSPQYGAPFDLLAPSNFIDSEFECVRLSTILACHRAGSTASLTIYGQLTATVAAIRFQFRCGWQMFTKRRARLARVPTTSHAIKQLKSLCCCKRQVWSELPPLGVIAMNCDAFESAARCLPSGTTQAKGNIEGHAHSFAR